MSRFIDEMVEKIWARNDEMDEEFREFRRREMLAHMPYQEYLETRHWQTIRKRALNCAGHRCQVCNCGEVELHVHHRTYERRGNERLDDLTVLCRECHQTFHDTGKLAKRTGEAANQGGEN